MPIGFIFALDNLQGFHKLLWLKAVQSALYFHGVLKNRFTVITLCYICDTPFMQLTYMFFFCAAVFSLSNMILAEGTSLFQPL
jgi:hypothetical protein